MTDSEPIFEAARVNAVKQWLKKWNKFDVEDAQAISIASKIESGSDAVIEALKDIDIVIKSAKRKEFERVALPALKKSLEMVIAEMQKAITHTVKEGSQITHANDLPRQPEKISGPGPFRNLTCDESISMTHANRAIEKLDLNGIYKTCRELSDFEPSVNPIDVHVFASSNPEGTQGAFDATYSFALGDDPETRRLMMYPSALSSFKNLQLNYAFLKADPEEAKGVIAHEFGHLWTQRILAAFPGRTHANQEAFAELFRSAVAMRDGKKWKQALGCSGYQILHGEREPKLMPTRECEVPAEVSHASRFLACNRIIELLGGLDERQLHGVAKACAIQQYPHRAEPLEVVLRDIERETGVRGFADAFMHDGILKPGNMKPGLTAIAFPNAAGTCCKIDCFEITDVAALYGQSKQTYENFREQKTNVNSDTFFFHEPQVTYPSYTVTVSHIVHGAGLKQTGSGEMNFSPQYMMQAGANAGVICPAGEYRLTFQLEGQQPVEIGHTINITPQEREYWCNILGIRSNR